jgi:hypothetical protein
MKTAFAGRWVLGSMAILGLSGCVGERWLEYGTWKGEALFAKSRVPGFPDIGGIEGMVRLKPRPGDPEAIVVSGTKGAAFLDPRTLEVRHHVNLNDGGTPYLPYRVLDANGDGTIEFLREPNSSAEATLNDLEGRLLWEAETPGGGFPHIAWGDTEGDGTLRFLLWSLGSRKVSLVDPTGRVVWTDSWEKSSQFLIADIDGDRRAEILSIDGKELHARDGAARLLWSHPVRGARYVNDLDLLTPDEKGRVRVGVGFNQEDASGELAQHVRVLALDRAGPTPVKDISTSDLWGYLPREIVPEVRLFRGEPPCQVRVGQVVEQAQIAGFSATGLNLIVKRADGETVYHETIAPTEGRRGKGDGAMMVLGPARGDPTVLVGFDETLWAYRP